MMFLGKRRIRRGVPDAAIDIHGLCLPEIVQITS